MSEEEKEEQFQRLVQVHIDDPSWRAFYGAAYYGDSKADEEKEDSDDEGCSHIAEIPLLHRRQQRGILSRVAEHAVHDHQGHCLIEDLKPVVEWLLVGLDMPHVDDPQRLLDQEGKHEDSLLLTQEDEQKDDGRSSK